MKEENSSQKKKVNVKISFLSTYNEECITHFWEYFMTIKLLFLVVEGVSWGKEELGEQFLTASLFIFPVNSNFLCQQGLQKHLSISMDEDPRMIVVI